MGISGINPSQLTSQPSPVPAKVGPGSAAKDVHIVQEQLKELGYKVNAKEDKADTYGASTQAAVSQFQKDMLLPVTGVADGDTQLAMERVVRMKREAETVRQQAQAQLQKDFASFNR